MRFGCLILLCLSFSVAWSGPIPALSRKYDLPCSSCHVHGAKLNGFGQLFRQRGAKAAALEAKDAGVPLTVWASLLHANRADQPDRFRTFPSRLELISFDEIGNGGKYFVEWFPVSLTLRADGSRVDRSGRFENLFHAFPIGEDFDVQVGQFRPLSVIDPNRRISVSESFALSSSDKGRPGGNEREEALRAFSPTFRSPAARLSWTRWDDPDDIKAWQIHATLAFPGEFSIPLTREARDNADFRFEERAKGAFIEVVRQTGEWAASAFHFSGDAGRRQLGVAGSIDASPWHLEAALWSGRGRGIPDRKRTMLDFSYAKQWAKSYGLRIDGIEGERSWLVPYASFHAGNPNALWRFAIEARIRKGTPTVWAIEIHLLR